MTAKLWPKDIVLLIKVTQPNVLTDRADDERTEPQPSTFQIDLSQNNDDINERSSVDDQSLTSQEHYPSIQSWMHSAESDQGYWNPFRNQWAQNRSLIPRRVQPSSNSRSNVEHRWNHGNTLRPVQGTLQPESFYCTESQRLRNNAVNFGSNLPFWEPPPTQKQPTQNQSTQNQPSQNQPTQNSASNVFQSESLSIQENSMPWHLPSSVPSTAQFQNAKCSTPKHVSIGDELLGLVSSSSESEPSPIIKSRSRILERDSQDPDSTQPRIETQYVSDSD